MKTKYIYNDYCYVLNNFSTALNPIFISNADSTLFKEKMEKYLSPLCEILAYNLTNYEFQIVVQMKERQIFEDFFIQKMNQKGVDDYNIPESTYILSQEMANLLSGYVKYFNHKYSRKGALFARRFSKSLIESENELIEIINEVNNKKSFIKRKRVWSYRKRTLGGYYRYREIRESSKDWLNISGETIIVKLIDINSFLLQGRFNIPSINAKNSLIKRV